MRLYRKSSIKFHYKYAVLHNIELNNKDKGINNPRKPLKINKILNFSIKLNLR